MYTNKELANAVKILKDECASHKKCLVCPLRYYRRGVSCILFAIDDLHDDEIKELGERDG